MEVDGMPVAEITTVAIAPEARADIPDPDIGSPGIGMVG
jgi:hypothetical protein